jgi:hypothetical protein
MMCAVAAWAGTGTLTYSITPSGSKIACDIGPPYTGNISAGAVRAGYTHCAVSVSGRHFTPSGWSAAGLLYLAIASRWDSRDHCSSRRRYRCRGHAPLGSPMLCPTPGQLA